MLVKVRNLIKFKKKSKGFTLVELIATIIIIGVLLLIIIPTVSDTLKKSEKNTFAASARGVIRAGTDFFASTGFTYDEGDCISATSDELEMDKDHQIIGGSVCYIGGQTYLKRVTDGKYCATGNSDTLSVFECDKTVTLTFKVEEAFYDYVDYTYNVYGYSADPNGLMFTNASPLYDYSNTYYNDPYNAELYIRDFVIEAEIGTILGDYIAPYSYYGRVESIYDRYVYGYMSGYNFWDLRFAAGPRGISNFGNDKYKIEQLGGVMRSCYYGLIPYKWDTELDSEMVIINDMEFTVTELGYGDGINCPER
ncbi:MAG: prepilin-type N-terminal cleavage/methylation domain-containing protein [Bacilli bacterium]|nr:prepilin-type N-terminal cleavage/methylation domain-containing protein [Bacilli bacterium]